MSKKQIEKFKAILKFRNYGKDSEMRATLKSDEGDLSKYKPSDFYVGLVASDFAVGTLVKFNNKLESRSKYIGSWASVEYSTFLPIAKRRRPIFLFTVDFMRMTKERQAQYPSDLAEKGLFVAVRSGEGERAQFRITNLWTGESLSTYMKKAFPDYKSNDELYIIPLALNDTLTVSNIMRKEDMKAI